MKRYVDELLLLYADLLTDAEYAYPALRADFERDRVRISNLAKCRGLPFFLVDLPALGKHLDRCVARQQYIPSHTAGSKPVRHNVVVIPKLFRGLYLLLFDDAGVLKEDVDEQAYLILRQLLLGAKKANVECSDSAVENTISAFVTTDSDLPVPVPSWETPQGATFGEEFKGFAADEYYAPRVKAAFGNERGIKLLRQLDLVAGIVATTLGPFEAQEWEFKHGPGSVSDVPTGQDRYAFLNWTERLESVYPVADCGHYNWLDWVDEIRLDRIHEMFCGKPHRNTYEPSSRLLAVPKSLTKPRLIASEPSEMMFCQQNIRQFVYKRFHDTWLGGFVNFHDQTQNRVMALAGSVDGSLATIDLSDASDRVSCQVVGNVFRGNLPLLRALAATRTRLCEVPLAGSRESTRIVELRKYSTMGNATTFPVQSIVFLVTALACCCEEERIVNPRILRRWRGKVSVFGDDIIVPNEIARTVMDLLEALGFKVNTAKSFTEGNFRESCGIDAFRGHCVTPAYWHGTHDGSPESYISCVNVSNNFYSKFFVTTAEGIRRRFQEHEAIRVPLVPVNSGVHGFESFVAPPTRCPSRWNKGLQIEEVKVPVAIQVPELKTVCTSTNLMQYFTERPAMDTPWKAGIRLKPMMKIRHRWVPTTQLLAKPIVDNIGARFLRQGGVSGHG